MALRDLLLASSQPEPCRDNPGLVAGDVAECGCVISGTGAHISRGRVWVRVEQAEATTYYGWRMSGIYGVSAYGRELRIVER